MGYSFNKVASLGLSYLDNDNSRKTPMMGTFGIGIQRCLYALFQKARLGDKYAFNRQVRPFDVVIVPMIENDEAVNQVAADLAQDISRKGLSVVIDDRKGTLSEKLKLADLFSVSVRIPIGRKEMSSMQFEVRSIGGHISSDVRRSYVPDSVKNSIQPKM